MIIIMPPGGHLVKILFKIHFIFCLFSFVVSSSSSMRIRMNWMVVLEVIRSSRTWQLHLRLHDYMCYQDLIQAEGGTLSFVDIREHYFPWPGLTSVTNFNFWLCRAGWGGHSRGQVRGQRSVRRVRPIPHGRPCSTGLSVLLLTSYSSDVK